MTDTERMLPLYQGMMATFFNHRAADVVKSETAVKRQNQPRYLDESELADTARLAQPAYWVRESLMPPSLPDWLLAFSNVSSPTNERSMVAYPLPRAAVGHSIPLIMSLRAGALLAILTSFALDYALRQKLGGVNLTYNYVQQLPVPGPATFARIAPWGGARYTVDEFLRVRVLALGYTAEDMRGFATDLGYAGDPFAWSDSRRSVMRAELDAAMFHLYGIGRDDVDYIMETFPIVKRKDLAAHGEYLTKRLILEIYDQMAVAITTGKAYVSEFDQSNSP